jgi:hypothetical protein
VPLIITRGRRIGLLRPHIGKAVVSADDLSVWLPSYFEAALALRDVKGRLVVDVCWQMGIAKAARLRSATAPLAIQKRRGDLWDVFRLRKVR